jgi:CDP-glycerol glycerophosphotransferase (TagB/SpsB family)
MPTWRRELLADQSLGNERGLLDGFWESDFALAWRRVLESDRLRALCEREGWQLTFLPHPNMQDSIDTSPLPSHVVARRFGTVDIQTVLARAAAFVTDYSSLAMEAAFLDRPVVYYQFDRDAFYSGRLYQPGDWSYQQQGFGPVTESADAVVDALETIAHDGGPAPEYADRMQRTFPFRDGHCCERTVAAIRAITPG